MKRAVELFAFESKSSSTPLVEATWSTIRQIQRGEQAVDLLGRGVPALDVVGLAGYADQPHLTRSLKRFVGQTPS